MPKVKKQSAVDEFAFGRPVDAPATKKKVDAPEKTTAHRLTLLALCNAVSPALASGSPETPVLGSFCFGDGTVHAFDELLAMECNLLNFPIRGAVPGKQVLAWLDATSGKEIEVSGTGSTMDLKVGRTEGTFPVAPTETFLFDRPDLSKAPKFVVAINFRERVAVALSSMDSKGEHAWRLGITASFEADRIVLYTCDNVTATRVTAKAKVDKALVGTQIIIPPRFVEAALASAKTDQEFFITEDWIATKTEGTMIYGSRRGLKADLSMYASLFEDAKVNLKKVIKLPQTWRAMLTRANIFLAGVKDPQSRLIIADGRLLIETEAPTGRNRDIVKLAGPHDAVTSRISPSALLQAPEKAEDFVITPQGGGYKLTMSAKGFTFVASVLGAE